MVLDLPTGGMCQLQMWNPYRHSWTNLFLGDEELVKRVHERLSRMPGDRFRILTGVSA